MEYTGWTDDRIEKLRKLWADGLSASECARHIGGGFSRNAVIGKVTRLGLPGRKVKVRRPANDRWNTEDRRMERGEKPFKQAVIRAKPNWRAEALPDTPATDVATITSILDLEPHHCRWPIGDPKQHGFGFCGCKKVEGLPYCNAHARRAYAPPKVAQPYLSATGLLTQNMVKADIKALKNVEDFVT